MREWAFGICSGIIRLLMGLAQLIPIGRMCNKTSLSKESSFASYAGHGFVVRFFSYRCDDLHTGQFAYAN